MGGVVLANWNVSVSLSISTALGIKMSPSQ